MIKFITAAAAIALVANGAFAEPGGGKGGGPGGGQGKVGGDDHAAHAQAQPGRGQAKRNAAAPAKQAAVKQDSGEAQASGHGKSGSAEVRNHGRAEKPVAPGRGKDVERQAERKSGQGAADKGRGRDIRVVGNDNTRFDWNAVIPARSRGLVAGCPPGLAKKNTGCMPPGLARKGAGAMALLDRPEWWGLDDRWYDGVDWNDGRYGYYDGYLVRYGDSGIDSWLPLLGGGLAPGNLWPNQFEPVTLPPYYQDYYGLGSPDSYRYYDDTLFRVDPQSQAITAIAALLTGNSVAVGQPMPPGYEVYNVPYSYRDQYVDGPDWNYRYSDGSIYQIDPTTQLVQAAIQLLT
jgi:hypothetical protein